ncbi:phage tail protein [Enterobacter sp. Ap-916]|uniref:CfaE/CblD family pilus tip adhesin n=1 Tax=Enterobacteriaceae TaxID=543 RepID=UPI000272976C|nr:MULTISPECIES: CfaE/CblD family pilus tip adhesin [unclassified Enterobacter]EJF29549.1 CblD family pilus biogenesis initiator protein [Enterobacter sp. Ag1]NIF61073.1 phage tail protein [Enterobacter sp. Ap-867]NIG32238.1 phage tail protein [Enterobacter sp. Ap-916]
MYFKNVLLYLISFLSIVSFSCKAIYEPPMNRTTNLTAEFDKNSLPASLIIWNALSGGQDDTNGQKWGRNTLTCLNATDTTYGACATTSSWWYNSTDNRLYVRLSFSLKGSSTKVDLNITPIKQWNVISGGCAGQSKNTPASMTTGCDNALIVTSDFTYSIPQSELAKLSSPGTWTATLKQNLRLWDNGYGILGVWSADISLTVTDLKSQQVYFPTFPYSTPQVNLNLSNRTGTKNTQSMSGKSVLDMCLYDGKNSTSSQVNMIFSDERASAPGRQPGFFSVYRNGADKSQAENRVDYQLSVLNPTSGQSQIISNGAEVLWKNTNERKIQRQVVIPGVSGVSLCVPAPLTFTTPQFRFADKSAGIYSGKLTVIYTPSTQSNLTN